MIAFVNGIIDEISEDRVVIDVGGIGYNVNISSLTAASLPAVGENIKLYTYTVVREDAFLLYGFILKDELNLFKKLISVNGVGPKGGLAILSIGQADDIRFAILSGDAKTISKAPGIGKKTAERIVLELKDKLSWNNDMISKEVRVNNSTISLSQNTGAKGEAVSALVALGYSSAEAHKAIGSLDISDDMDCEAILKVALGTLL